MKLVSKAIRESARGEACTIQIPGVCNHNRETTVLGHSPFGDESGTALKELDLFACYICSDCHDALDHRVQYGFTDDQVRLWFYPAMTKTQKRLIRKGIILISDIA